MLKAQARWGGSSQLKISPVANIQNYLKALQTGARVTGTYDTQTQSAWDKYVKVFREPHDTIAVGLAERGGLTDYKNVWISTAAAVRLRDRGTAASSTTPKAPSTPTARPSTPKAPTSATKNMDANTLDVQGVLLRLGWPTSKDLTDGTYGGMTAGYWAQSSRKRGLDPYIVKKTADGKTVTVREATYLKLKAVADALAPGPTPEPVGGSLLSLPPDQTATLPLSTFAPLLSRVSGVKDRPVDETYTTFAKGRNLDPRIEAVPPDKVIVMKASWDALVKIDSEKGPIQPPPGAEKEQLRAAVRSLVAASTESVPTNTIRVALNAAIREGKLQLQPFADKGPFENALREPMLQFMGITTEPGRTQWATALDRTRYGMTQHGDMGWAGLVSDRGTEVKLPPKVAASFKQAAAKFIAAGKEAKEILQGYTEVNSATLIEQINALGVTTKKFDKSGGPLALADALTTFFEETKTSKPSGDSVKTASKTPPYGKVYVKDDVLKALAATAMSIKARADATKAYRDQMVRNALQASAVEIPVTAFQEAMLEMVLSKASASPLLTLAKRVKVSGAFDSPTREAYTEVARTSTIGPAVQEYQRLLVAQQQAMTTAQVNASVLEVQKQVWNDFLNQAVIKKGSVLSIKTLPAIATSVTSASDLYRKTVSQDKQHDAILAAQNKVLADAVAKSTAIMSILDVQQGLSNMAEVGKIKKTGVKITGRADKATNGFPNGGLFAVSSYIFQEGYAVPEIVWNRYLKAVGIVVVSAAQVKAAWNEANYIALPPALADTLSKAASEWILKYGEPGAGVNLFPLPLDNQELRLRFKTPTVVTVQRKKKEEAVEFKDKETKEPVVEVQKRAAERLPKARKKARAAAQALKDAEQRAADAEKRAKDAADLARQQQTDFANKEAERLKYEAAQANQAVQQRTQEATQANTTLNLTINAAGGAGGAAAGGEAPTPAPSAPEPTPEPIPTPAPTPGGGGGAGILLGLLALVGVGVALSKGQSGDANPETV
jgi:hypothetical protein